MTRRQAKTLRQTSWTVSKQLIANSMTKKVLFQFKLSRYLNADPMLDREAFEELCKPSSAPVFRMPFRPRDLGIGSPLAELDIGPPLAELEG